ncbi:MAG: adenine phosphoribosyltransferase, partial [Kiritimatiellae bacterium]|nr:adenine phosphoribosyltransferase [Kiritimatiellia bacterium]
MRRAPQYDYLFAPEAKAIPLLYEMSRQSGKKYFLARKKKKLYMQNILEVVERSITTEGEQKLYLDGADAQQMSGKRVLLLDDVISTGESMK